MASVRGIGVAVITSMCGGFPSVRCRFLCHNFARCFTPNRCCSSIMAKPSLLYFTTSSSKACVPINIFNCPFSRLVWISFLRFVLVDPVKRAIGTFISDNNSDKDSKCCVAKISVGAINVA